MKKLNYLLPVFLLVYSITIGLYAQPGDPDIERLQKTAGIIEKVNAISLEFKRALPELAPAGAANVQKQAALLKQLPPGTVVEIGVHTIAVGDESKNVVLTQNRAEKIRSMLVAAGIPAAGLTAKGYGGSKPLTAIAADDKNRRVEYLVIKSPPSAAVGSNLAAPNPAPSGSAIVAGRGWGSARIGSTREEVEAGLGKPEFFEDSSFPPNESYGSYYQKGLVVVYQTRSLRAIHLRFIGDGMLYATGSVTFGSCQGQPDKGLAWKASVAEVVRAYGTPLKREAYNEYKTKIEIVHLTYPGAEFLFKGDKLFQINVGPGAPAANIEPASTGQGQTAGKNDAEELFDAVGVGNEAAVRDLIKRGAGLNFERKDETPLILAIRNRKTDIAKLLLEAGADPNLADSMNGGTPLRWAVQMSNVEIVEMLINHYNVDVNFRPKNGITALHTAADFNRDERITVMLLAAGSDANVLDGEGRSPLDLAIMGRKPAIAPLLEKATNPRVIARLKQEYAAQPKVPKPVPQAAAAVTPPAPKKQYGPDEDDPDEIASMVSDTKMAARKVGFELYDEGTAVRQGRNSNSESGGIQKAVSKGKIYQFVIISKDALAINAVMNGTLLTVPCNDCRTSISTYSTSIKKSSGQNGYYLLSFQMQLENFQDNYVTFIPKGNTAGKPVKWLYFAKPAENK